MLIEFEKTENGNFVGETMVAISEMEDVKLIVGVSNYQVQLNWGNKYPHQLNIEFKEGIGIAHAILGAGGMVCLLFGMNPEDLAMKATIQGEAVLFPRGRPMQDRRIMQWAMEGSLYK